MARYAVDDATNWRQTGEGLDADAFLAGLHEAGITLEELEVIEAPDPVRAAELALDLLDLRRIDANHVIFLYDLDALRLVRVKQAVSWVIA